MSQITTSKSSSLSAECINYEEYLDASQNVVTHYLVNVVFNQQSYQLKKRYSEFSELYAAVKDRYPTVFQPYRFPNKSMFNTHSQFTKERRRQGFDELVKLCCVLKPLPKEVEEFLELDEDDCGASLIPGGVLQSSGVASGGTHQSNEISAIQSQSDASSTVVASSNIPNVPSSGVTRSVSSGSIAGANTTKERRRQGSSADSKLPKGMVDVATAEESLRVQKRDYFLQVLPSSACLAAGGYATLVAGNVIDISSTNSARMILTVLFFAFSLNVFRTLFFEASDKKSIHLSSSSSSLAQKAD